ncbi:MAG: MFS transporter [Alphaproteobacteria bacterium]|nr:MAG: MFS transporter [Alphaproteobacteria bacterium]
MSEATSSNGQGANKSFILIVIAASCLVAVMFGSRNSLSLTIQGIDQSNTLDYLQISFAFALGQLIVGAISPFGGMIADKYGTGKTLTMGILLALFGMLLIPYSTNVVTLSLSLGIISSIGLGIAGLPVVLASVNKLISSEKVGMAFGLVNAGQSLGQLILAPIAGLVVVSYGWVACIIFLSIMFASVLPFSYILRSRLPSKEKSAPEVERGLAETLRTAFKTPSYVYLVSGFFVCGFHVAFIATHMPGVIASCGLPPTVSGWSLGLIGLFNIVGSIFAGWYISRYSMRLFLSYTYFARCLIVLCFLISPKDLVSVLIFSIALGFTYFSVIPATAGLVGKMFGPKFMATLFGFALFSHQIGGFLGAYLGGYFFSISGDYTTVWLLDASLAIFAALIHLPIKEKLVYSEAN